MVSPGSAMVGRDFGGYQIIRELGVGGMGVVYLGEHRLLGRRAAIKIIRSEIANDRSFSRRFLLEARAVGALNHPSIVRLYDFAFEEDTPYMAMEYVTGQSLEHVLSGGRMLDARAAVELLTPIAAALNHAHKHGVVHRDVKPANVLLADDGRTLIMDFGLASMAGFSISSESESFVGTPDYIAPEQVAGQPVDGRADVYSLSAVIYEAVTGDRPWTGRSWMEIVQRRLTEPPPVARNVPPEFSAALAVGMARQPELRPRTATALLESLSATLEPAAQPVALRQTVRAPAVVAGAEPSRTGVLEPAASLPVVSGGGEPSAPRLAGQAAPVIEVALEQAPTEPALPQIGLEAPTEPCLPAVPAHAPGKQERTGGAGARLPMISLVVVAAVIGLTLALAWLTILHDPVRGALQGITGR